MSRAGSVVPIALLMLAWAIGATAAQLPFVVVLDPGHGGDDTGAIATNARNRQVFEKNITLSLARQTMRILKARGIRTLITRGADRFVPLNERTSIANQAAVHAQNIVFVSIHANSSEDARSAGAETYVFNAATNEASRRLADLENGKRFSQNHATLDLILTDLASTANYAESVSLACDIQNTVVGGMQHSGQSLRDRGIRKALFYVLMETQMPGILFEPGFMSNAGDLAHLVSPAYQQTLARNLAQGIIKWRQRLRRSPSMASASAIDKKCVPRSD